MNVIHRIEKFIFEADLWKLILVIILIQLFRTGIWYIPNFENTRVIAQDPFINPFLDPNSHYLLMSWLGPFLAWLLGATGRLQFFVFHLFFSIAFTFLFIKMVFSLFSDRQARASLIILSTLPVSATAYFWVSSDSITLFLMLLAFVFPGSLIFSFIVGVLLGMQHFEQAFFAVMGLLFAVSRSHQQGYALRYSKKFCWVLLTGVFGGKILLLSIFSYFSMEVNSGRIYWLMNHIHLLINDFFFHFHYIVWSVLGLGWLIALRFADGGKKSVPFFVSLAGLCLLLPIAGDPTRVLAIITFPLILVYWLLNPDFLEKLTQQEISLLFITWVLIPWGWVWGSPKSSVFPYDIAYILHEGLGWFNLPADLDHWPF